VGTALKGDVERGTAAQRHSKFRAADQSLSIGRCVVRDCVMYLVGKPDRSVVALLWWRADESSAQ
jgi:hypothetical protein